MKKALLKLANDIQKNEDAYKNVMSMLDKHFASYGGSIDNDFINGSVEYIFRSSFGQFFENFNVSNKESG